MVQWQILLAWEKKFPDFLEKKVQEGIITKSTTWREVQQIWAKEENFEKLAQVCLEAEKFNEAMYWLFQHKVHRLNPNEEYPLLSTTSEKCVDKWKNFPAYLKEAHENEILNAFTTWGQIKLQYEYKDGEKTT